MKAKTIAYSLAPALAVGLLVAGIASAHGSLLRQSFGGQGFGGFGNATPEEVATRQTTMFQHKADLLGVSVDEVKDAWAQGQTIRDLAQEKGISDEELQTKMKEQRDVQMKERLETLVGQGVITQAQADQRYEWMSAHASQGKGPGRGMGFGHHMGFGL